MLLRYLLIVFCFCFYASTAYSTPIYKWTDDAGVTHYSSKSDATSAQPAKLPPITRGEVKLAKKLLISCQQHGGINCQAGADSDGSVICYDGFKQASARYRFSCSSPKLEITEVSDPMPDGRFSVFVRNSKSVSASKPALYYKPEGQREVRLEGPEEIEAFGMAEFKFQAVNADIPDGKVSLTQLNITCANCS